MSARATYRASIVAMCSPTTSEVSPCALRSAVLPFRSPSSSSPPRRSAAVPHTVQPGETLWSIAAANNLTTRTVAAYNGLSEDAQVVLGSTITRADRRRGLRRAAEGRASCRRRPRRRRAPRAATAPGGRARGRAAPPLGGYTVRWGDTLSGLAAGAGVSVSAHGRDERPRPRRRPARRHRDQAADRRPGARARVRARAGAAVVPAAAPEPTPARAQRRRRPAGRRRATASRPRSPPRSPGRRAASTTAWSPAPTRAASCR